MKYGGKQYFFLVRNKGAQGKVIIPLFQIFDNDPGIILFQRKADIFRG